MRNNICICIICSLLFVGVANKSYSQIPLEDPLSDIQKARVGLVDEFMKRFNGDTSHPEVSPQDSSYRKKNLLYLIEPQRDVANKDSLYNKAVKFIETVIGSSIRLNYCDSTWIAYAKCKGKLEGKQVTFNIYLNVEHRKEDMYKWVIAKVEGDCFNVSPQDSINNIMLYPDDHETKFISLGRMTKEQPYNVRRFMSKGFQYDATSAFVYLVNSKKLKIDYVDELEFIFTQIPGYIFSIKYIERESDKLGWLIHKFEPISDAKKKGYINELNLKFKYSKGVATEKIQPVNEDLNLASETELRELFYLRMSEYKYLLRDYISFLGETNDTVEIEFYKKKLTELFSPDSYAYIHNANNAKTNRMSVLDLFKKIASHKIKILCINKITVPKWNGKLSAMDAKKDEFQLKGYISQFDDKNSFILEESDQMLLVRKEITEDGTEWIPCFGDIYITIE